MFRPRLRCLLIPLAIGCSSTPARTTLVAAATSAPTAAAEAGPVDALKAFSIQRVDDRGFVILPDVPVPVDRRVFAKLNDFDAFFDGTFTTLEIAEGPTLDRALTFSLPGADIEREITTTRTVVLRVRRDVAPWARGRVRDPEAAKQRPLGVLGERLAVEIDLSGVARDDAPFAVSARPSGRRLVRREPMPSDSVSIAALDAWLGARGFARAGELITHWGFVGTQVEEIQTWVAGDRLMVWRIGDEKVFELRTSVRDTVWSHLVVTDGRPVVVIVHWSARNVLERRLTLHALRT
jgi:hypothetical protein